jgi:hypothetical protein
VLFNSGVGYFQREGNVDGNEFAESATKFSSLLRIDSGFT